MAKVRFAPSPTGYLHIGGARTCLFSWLYARKTKGKFVLRIEDTDLERSKKEYLQEILESIKWLGMDWDDIYYQAQRFDIYRDYAQKLIDDDKAYRKDGAVFFKYDFSTIELDDAIRGKIIFNELPKDEEVIIKSDNSPTYNFSCVIDDALMGIDYVIRGEDHISNTPKQILMYKALGFDLPRFAHAPLILSPDGGRMSKRYGATSIREYREMGYLPEAIVNYLLFLGWSPKDDKEILTTKEAIDLFDIIDVNKTSAAFSMDKLKWVNGEYMKQKSPKQLCALIRESLSETEFIPKEVDDILLEKIIVLLGERIITLRDFKELAYFCFYDDYQYSEDASKILANNLTKEINCLIDSLAKIENYEAEIVEREFRGCADNLGVKVRVLVHPTRVALTGQTKGPGLFESMVLLGKDRVEARLKRLIDYWKEVEE
ncbi:MAG: glutamate--tRNA ligase [Candidatus Omnitrophica bacterium]|nr:glutamate--tRNA ligase [Candidatus Omnitrophota bacterium]